MWTQTNGSLSLKLVDCILAEFLVRSKASHHYPAPPFPKYHCSTGDIAEEQLNKPKGGFLFTRTTLNPPGTSLNPLPRVNYFRQGLLVQGNQDSLCQLRSPPC